MYYVLVLLLLSTISYYCLSYYEFIAYCLLLILLTQGPFPEGVRYPKSINMIILLYTSIYMYICRDRERESIRREPGCRQRMGGAMEYYMYYQLWILI